MGVDHSGSYVAVTEEVLDGAEVVAGLEQVRGEAVTQAVTAGRFGNASYLDCPRARESAQA